MEESKDIVIAEYEVEEVPAKTTNLYNLLENSGLLEYYPAFLVEEFDDVALAHLDPFINFWNVIPKIITKAGPQLRFQHSLLNWLKKEQKIQEDDETLAKVPEYILQCIQ